MITVLSVQFSPNREIIMCYSNSTFCGRKMQRLLLFLAIYSISFLAQRDAFAQTVTGSFKFEGKLRNYKVFFPENYSSAESSPLVIYLHCYGFYASWGASYTGLHRVADTLGYITVYPDALDNWNSGVSDNPRYPTTDTDDVGFINALIDTMENRYSIDPERIYACGFSNGGFMSYKLACQLSNRLAAVASVSGVLSNSIAANCKANRSIPVLQIFGTGDNLYPGNNYFYSAEATFSYWLSNNNCTETTTTNLPDLDPEDGCTVEKISYTNCANNRSMLYYRIHGGGHTWPGGNTDKYSDGNTNNDINANYEILKFFNESQLTPTSVENYKNELLFSTYPNPFDSETTISFQIQKQSKLEIRIYSTTGQEIRTYLYQNLTPGTHELTWDGTNNFGENVSGGLYLISLSTLDFNKTSKVIFVR